MAELPVLCPRCRQPWPPSGKRCPVCDWRMYVASPATLEASAEPLTDIPGGRTFTISGLMLVTTAVAICLAMIVALPGLGILLSILAVPPVFRTILVVQARKRRSLPTDHAKTVTMFVSSALVTLITVTAVLGTSLLTLCGACFAAMGTGVADDSAFWLALGLAFLVGLAVFIGMSFWMRARWRRDTRNR